MSERLEELEKILLELAKDVVKKQKKEAVKSIKRYVEVLAKRGSEEDFASLVHMIYTHATGDLYEKRTLGQKDKKVPEYVV